MSFSSEIKEELSHVENSARHCQIAELTAIITMCGGVTITASEHISLKIHTENLNVARRYADLLHQAFHISGEVGVRSKKSARTVVRTYSICIADSKDAQRVLEAAHLLGAGLEVEENMSLVDNVIIKRSCCRRAFLRGAFLVSGSISDPHKAYHFEIVCNSPEKAQQLCGLMRGFELDAKTIVRKGHHVVYLKEGNQIVDMLGVMEASLSLMDMENVRILREISNTINRKVNCETANLNKTVSAAVRQVDDILFLQEKMGLENLPDQLREMAYLRLDQRDTALKDLGQYLDPPIGKSGVNHRLQKLSDLAEKLREEQSRGEDNE